MSRHVNRIALLACMFATLLVAACDKNSRAGSPAVAAAEGPPPVEPSKDTPNRRLLAGLQNEPAITARSGNGTTWSEYFGSTEDADHLIVQVNDSVELDICDVKFASLLIHGQLTVDDSIASCEVVSVEAETLVVSGSSARLSIGSNADPFDGKLRLTLTGDVSGPARHDAEQRMLMVREGATLEIYGASASKRSWTSLDRTVRRGESTITLADDSQWQPGDTLVIAASNLDPREAEMRVIVATDGRTLTLDEPLRFDHFGEQQLLDGRTLDSRAEVGLLSHSVVIEGDESSALTGHGATIVIVGDSVERPGTGDPLTRVEIEGLELRHVGQIGRTERYAFLWYFVGDGRNQFLRKSAIHHGYQRGVSLIDTDDVTVENVVSFDIRSHAFVPSERGNEVRNTFRHNLAVLTRRVFEHQEFAFPGEVLGQSNQSEHRASAFWLRNTFNFIEGNRAAGVLGGHGFYFQPVDSSFLSAYKASGTENVCAFENNLAHSLFGTLDDSVLTADNAAGFGLFMNHPGLRLQSEPEVTSRCIFDGFTAYKAQSGGVWLQNNTTLLRGVVADSQAGVVGGDVLDDVLVSAQTLNALNSYPLPVDETNRAAIYAHPEYSLGGFVALPLTEQSSRKKRFNALGCVGLTACFVAFGNDAGQIDQFAGAAISSVRLIDTPQGFIERSQRASFMDGDSPDWGQFTDVNGSLTGVPDESRSMSHSDFFDIRLPLESVHGWVWDASLPNSDGS